MGGNIPRSALVTGGSRGIGRATAIRLAANGHRVAVNYNSHPEEATAVVEEIRATGGTAIAVGGSVASKETAVAMIDAAVEAHGPIEILINNAGVTGDNLLMRMKEEEWETVIDTNLGSMFKVTKACIKAMTKARWGRIVNVSSVVGSSGNAGQTNYGASKAGIEGFTRSLAKEVGSRGITVNAVSPGFIDTDMTRELSDKQTEALLSQIPLGRLGLPEEVAAVVGFLVSERGGYITGETVHVNGGMYMA